MNKRKPKHIWIEKYKYQSALPSLAKEHVWFDDELGRVEPWLPGHKLIKICGLGNLRSQKRKEWDQFHHHMYVCYVCMLCMLGMYVCMYACLYVC